MIRPWSALLSLGFALLLIVPVQAFGTLINFDDLPTQLDPSQRCGDGGPGSNCVEEEYEHLGVTFSGPMVYEPTIEHPRISFPNAVVNWAGVTFDLQFAEWAQPNYVSFDAWTTMMGGVYARAYNHNGELIADVQVESDKTFPEDGYWSTLPPTNIAVSAPDISRLEILGLPGRRSNLHMDNVYFGDEPPMDVPEPGTPALLLIVGGYLLRRLTVKGNGVPG